MEFEEFILLQKLSEISSFFPLYYEFAWIFLAGSPEAPGTDTHLQWTNCVPEPECGFASPVPPVCLLGQDGEAPVRAQGVASPSQRAAERAGVEEQWWV